MDIVESFYFVLYMCSMTLKYIPYQVRTKLPFGTAHGVRSHTDIMFFSMSSDGLTGFGEASMPPYYPENQATMRAFFDKLDPAAIKDCGDPESLHSYLSALSDADPAAKAAVDIAFHDLLCKKNKESVAEYYGVSPLARFDSCYTIGVSSKAEMLRNVEEFSSFKMLKVKLNGNDDLKLIESIREISDQVIWVDANQSWSNKSEAKKLAKRFEALGVEMIEQPFRTGRYDDVLALADATSIPIVADEDCQRLADIPKLSRYYDGINIKLMKCTGLYEGKQMIDLARSLSMKVMLGCMSETSIGISAASQIAPLVDWVDLDGNMSLVNDPCAGIKHVNGRLKLEGIDGIGLTDTLILDQLFIS